MEKNYLKYLFLFISTIILLTGTFNWFVNPYGVYKSPVVNGVNAEKTEFINYLRITKAYQVSDTTPSALILGTSRSGIGLDPDNKLWKSQKVYNLALPGSRFFELYRYYQHSNVGNNIKKIVLAVDFRCFVSNELGSGFSDSRMKIDEKGDKNYFYWFGVSSDIVSTLFSVDSLITSLKTIRHQGWTKEKYLPNGSWDRTSKQFDHKAAFTAYMKSTFNRLDTIKKHGIANLYGENYFSAMLQDAYNNDIELYILISPSHAWHWEAYRLKGLWNKFEDMKRMLVQTNEKEAIRAGKKAFPIWDFSGYNSFSTETVPKKGNMRWFWESVHYKKNLGNVVLDKIFNSDSFATENNNNFGIQINSQNIDAHLFTQRVSQMKYVSGHQKDIEFIKDIMNK